MRNIFLVPALFLSLSLLQSCNGDEDMPMHDAGTEYNPVSVAARADDDAAGAQPFPDGSDRFRLSAFITSDGAPSDWTVTPSSGGFENETVNIIGGKPQMANEKSYPPSASGKKLWFTAYAPSTGEYAEGNGAEGPKVNFTITGQEDIMTASVSPNGIAGVRHGEEQPQPSLRFSHLLMRLTFKLVRGEGFAEDIRASRLRISRCRKNAVLDLASGRLEFSGDPDGSVEVNGTWAIQNPEIAEEIPNIWLLCQPAPSVTVEIVAAGITYSAEIPLQHSGTDAGGAGVSYLLTLTFKGTHVEASAAITPWEDVGSVSGEIK